LDWQFQIRPSLELEKGNKRAREKESTIAIVGFAEQPSEENKPSFQSAQD
jgi:hypothetical protein